MKKFDKDKYLKKLKFQRVWRKYERYFYIGVPCLMIAMLGIYFTYSKFSSSKEEEVVKTTVGEFIHGDVVIGAYINGEYSKTIPGKNEGYIVDKIVCDNDAIGEWDNDKWAIVVGNMSVRSKCNIYFKIKPVPVLEKVMSAMSTDSSMFATDDQDNNIRYIGADPSNYVYFNCSDYDNQSDSACEKWRIIGVFNNVTQSDGTTENLVKIIRDESIGNYSWDNKDTTTGAETSHGMNDWTTARLNYLLNPGHDSESAGGSLYYNAKSGTCYYGQNNATTSCDFTSIGLKNDTTRNAIESVVWNLGGSSTYDDVTPSMFYERERGTTVYSGRPTTWIGKIGLMYPSDYGYATAGGSTANRTTCLSTKFYSWGSSSYSDCNVNDYLYKSGYSQWTLVPRSNIDYDMFFVNTTGTVNPSIAVFAYDIRPTLYLKSNVLVKSGNGTSETPYQLNLQ